MGSRGRSSPAYRAARAQFKAGNYRCALAGPKCEGRGWWVEHSPPLSAFATPEQWVGIFVPACPTCQRQQGASVTNGRSVPPWTF